MSVCAASSASLTAAPISSERASARIARSSSTWLTSMSTGGATMPRRILTTRSVPPPSSELAGWLARARITSSSVVARTSANSGSASIRRIPFRNALRCRPREGGDPYDTDLWNMGPRVRGDDSGEVDQSSDRSCGLIVGFARIPIAGAPALLQRREHAVGRDRQFVEAHPDGVGDGIGQRRQERRERALARLLGAERAVRIVAFDDADLDRRRILDGGHAVVEHVAGDEQAVVIGGLLAHGLAHAHPHRTLHLALDGEAVECLAAVVRDPHLVDVDHAGVLIDADFHHLRGVAVAHGAADGGAAIFLAAVRLRQRRVVARHRDGAGVLERLGHHLVEVQSLLLRAGAIKLAQALDLFGLGLQLARGRRYQHALEILRRVDGGIADHEGHARRVGAVVLGHHLAVAGDDAHAREVEAEHLGHGLHQDGRRSLPDVGGAREHDDGAVEIELDLDGGVRLAGPVHGLGRAADVVRAGKAQTFAYAALAYAALALRQLAPARTPAARLLDPVHALRQAVAVHHQVVVGERRRGQIVRAPHRQRIKSELARHLVEQALEGEADVDGAVAAERAARRRVGEDALADIFDVVQVVDGVEHRAGIENRHDAVAGMRAAALVAFALDGGDLAVLAHAELEADVGLRSASMLFGRCAWMLLAPPPIADCEV